MTCPKWTRGRAFSLKFEGDKRARRVSACEMVRDNRGDTFVIRGLRKLSVGKTFVAGGGAAPVVTMRRVK